jgi:hypothetical protein
MRIRFSRLIWLTLIGFLMVTGLQLIQATPTTTESRNALPAAAQVTATVAIPLTPTPEPSPTFPPLPTLRSAVMGIQAYANVEVERWWGLVDRAQFMGFKWMKMQLSWTELEPSKGNYTQQFGVQRENLLYAGRRGFKNLISIVNAPDWARPANARGKLNGPPADPKDLVDFVNAVLDQFGTQYINAIEIWNEPNLEREWTGAPINGAAYRRYFDAAYRAIRARSGQIVIITAGPAPGGSYDDRIWLQELYRAGLPVQDPNLAIGVHPYSWANPPDARCCPAASQGWDNNRVFFFQDTLADYRDIMLRNNHAQGKLWATEFGWSSFENLHAVSHITGPQAIPPDNPDLGWMSRLSEVQQAEYIIRAFQLAQAPPFSDFMGPMFLWNLNFASLPGFVETGKPSRPEAGFSVLDSDWATRRIYLLLQAAPRQ